LRNWSTPSSTRRIFSPTAAFVNVSGWALTPGARNATEVRTATLNIRSVIFTMYIASNNNGLRL
jgi:hypothetical protein